MRLCGEARYTGETLLKALLTQDMLMTCRPLERLTTDRRPSLAACLHEAKRLVALQSNEGDKFRRG
jgi:hypothetical protein